MKKAIALFLAMLILLLPLLPCAAAKSAAPESLFSIDKPLYTQNYILASLDDTPTILLQKNANKKKYPASLTKIVTALVVLEQEADLTKKVVVSKTAVEAIRNTGAQHAGLKAGQRVSLEQLLHLALVFSACDACQVLAEAVGGNVKSFVNMMNARVSALGCENTHFINPDGLHHKKQYSTAADLYRITLEALKNKDFVRICTAKSYRFAGADYYHTNKMLHRSLTAYYYPYAQGIKTGYTKQAGRCLITLAEKNGRRYLAILLDAPLKIDKKKQKHNTAYFDAKTLFEWAFNALAERTVLDPTRPVMRMHVADGMRYFVDLVPRRAVTALLPKDIDATDLRICPLTEQRQLTAPITAGDTACKAQIYYRDYLLGETDLIAAESVGVNWWNRLFRTVSGWFIN